MPQTRTTHRYLLVINMTPSPIDGNLVRRRLFPDDPRPGLEFMSHIGNDPRLATAPLDTIMREVDQQLDRRPQMEMICLVGDLDPQFPEEFAQEVARRTGLPVMSLELMEMLGS